MDHQHVQPQPGLERQICRQQVRRHNAHMAGCYANADHMGTELPGIYQLLMFARYMKGDNFNHAVALANRIRQAGGGVTFPQTYFAGLEIEWGKALGRGGGVQYNQIVAGTTPDQMFLQSITSAGWLGGVQGVGNFKVAFAETLLADETNRPISYPYRFPLGFLGGQRPVEKAFF